MTKNLTQTCLDSTKAEQLLTAKKRASKRKKSDVPSMRKHKKSGTAYVNLNGERHYLGGQFGSKEAERRYSELITEWLANGRKLPPPAEALTVKELCAQYLLYADKYYRHKDGKHTSQFHIVLQSLKALIEQYGELDVSEFSPKKLKTLMQVWVQDELSRTTVNAYAGNIKRCFKWGVSEEFVPPTIFHGLQAVNGLRAGRSEARESEPVQPVSESHIKLAKAHLSSTVRAMIELQLLTAARPGEIVTLKKSDIDMEGNIWTAELTEHKTSHHGKSRTLYFGPKSQKLLKPFVVKAGQNDYLFSPKVSEKERHSHATVHRRPNQKPNPRKTDRTLGDCYSATTYRLAIARACKKAEIPTWSPNQLRHNAATLIRKNYGLEAAQVILGHSSADITQVYAEVDKVKAIQVIGEVG